VGTYRFGLVFEDGEAADPPAFNTLVPGWRVGSEFLAGVRLKRFRIVGISAVTDKADPASEWFDAFWVVEPAGGSPAGR
jgi:hypothetical protein